MAKKKPAKKTPKPDLSVVGQTVVDGKDLLPQLGKDMSVSKVIKLILARSPEKPNGDVATEASEVTGKTVTAQYVSNIKSAQNAKGGKKKGKPGRKKAGDITRTTTTGRGTVIERTSKHSLAVQGGLELLENSASLEEAQLVLLTLHAGREFRKAR